MRIDKKHFAFIRLLPCIKCGTGTNIECSHLRKGTDGGMGLKPSPWFTLPLCFMCHKTSHSKGEVTFWGGIEGIEKAKATAISLYENSGNIFKGQRLVWGLRCDLF